MDVGALGVALIGALGGGVVAGVSALVRSRTSRRTAARLVYAELERNSAAVAFYRATGAWPATATSRSAWETNGEVLARARSTVLFESVSRGYAALDAVAYIARDRALSGHNGDRLVDENARWLTDALRSVGRAARIPDPQLDAVAERLTIQAKGTLPAGPRLDNVPASLLSQLVDIQLAVGQAPGSALDAAAVEIQVSGGQAPASAPAGAATAVAVSITVYDAGGGTALDRLPVVRTFSGPASGDVAVEETFDAMVHTVRFYREVFRRNSLDDAGGPVLAVVHYERDYNNSFWDGRQLVVGDGDGVFFGRFSACLEVLAHELSHEITGQVGLRFYGQSGALTESATDVLGLLVKQYTLGQDVAASDWLVGAGLLAPGIRGSGLRSLKAPGTAYDDERLGRDPQPAHMSDYVRTDSDNGGVHINCGIPSRAFYLLAAALGGFAWERAGAIWYRALTSGALPPTATFSTFAGATVAAAQTDPGLDGSVADAVRDAWRQVGVTPRVTKRALELTAARVPPG